MADPLTTPILTAMPLPALLAQADADAVVTPAVLLVFCAVAAVATMLLLPGGRSVAWRRLGGGLLGAAFLLLVIALLLSAGFVNVYFWAFAIIAIVGSVRVITHPQPVYSALYFVLTVFASAGLFILAYAEFMAVALIIIYAGAILITYTFVIMLAADAAPEETGPQGKSEAARNFVAEHDARARSPMLASIIGITMMGVLLFLVFEKAPLGLEKRLSVIEPIHLVRNAANVRAAGGVDIVQEGAADDVAAAAILADKALDEDVEVGVLDTVPRGDLYGYESRIAHAQEPDRGGVQVLGIYLFTRQWVTLQVAGLLLTVAMIGAIVISRRQIIPELLGGRREPDGGDTMTMPFTPVNDNPKSLPVVGSASPRQKAYPQN